jgi:FMN phosphatase YigB (HAD superfamily)
MGILDELETHKSKTQALIEWLESRPEDERAEWIEAMLATHRFSNAAIARLLIKRGFDGYTLRSLENVVYRYRGSLK